MTNLNPLLTNYLDGYKAAVLAENYEQADRLWKAIELLVAVVPQPAPSLQERLNGITSVPTVDEIVRAQLQRRYYNGNY